LHRKYSPFALHNPELCLKNIVQVKRLVDTIKYTGPIIAMSDNTKLKERLEFSSLYGYIVGSTLSTELTKVSSYEDIYQIVNTIKSQNAIASQVRIYLLQKDCQNALFSGAHLLSLGKYSARYNQILELKKNSQSIFYKKNIENGDRQNNGAAYRFFCSSLLSQVINKNNEVIMENYGLFVFCLFLGCEHFFGLARQFLPDFLFNDLVTLVPKIACLYKAYSSGSLKLEKEKTTGVGYISHYSDSSITENLEILRDWPSDDDIKGAINHAYKQATIEEVDCFTNGCSQLTFILSSTRRSQNCNIEENASIGITNEKLEISVLVNQSHSHEAYTNQRMKRKVAALSVSGSNYRFNSSLVSFFHQTSMLALVFYVKINGK
ncbi:22567_t:CDS:2, partial [Gigaspora rosea]